MAHDFDGNKYKQASSHQEEWGTRLMQELSLRGNERVLDLGCGDGRLTYRLAEMVPDGSVVGLDSASGMIEATRVHQRANLSFLRRDVQEVDEVEDYDVIFSNAALHWVPDHPRLLAACYRALRPGGIVRFNFAADGNCAQLFSVLHEVMSSDGYREAFSTFVWPWYMPGVEAYTELVNAVPFRDARVWGENADRHFPDAEAMIRWIDQPSLVPFLGHLPEELRAPFRTEVVDRMVALCSQPDGRCFEYFRRINVLARKAVSSQQIAGSG